MIPLLHFFRRSTNLLIILFIISMMLIVIILHLFFSSSLQEPSTYFENVKTQYDNVWKNLLPSSSLSSSSNTSIIPFEESEESPNSQAALWDYSNDDQDKIEDIFQRLSTPLYPEIPSYSSMNMTYRKQLEKDTLAKNGKIYNDFMSTPIIEPKVDYLIRPDDELAGSANATILSLVTNNDLKELLPSIQQLEEKFNKKFGYPYVFLNDGEFSEEFKDTIINMLPNGRVVKFGQIEKEDWDMPDTIDRERYKIECEKMDKLKVSYVKKESYHNMCRFYSRKFYHHPLLQEYKYTWRLEPGTSLYCDVDYDVFKFMEMENKVYGYVLNLYDGANSIPTLWETTMEFVKKNPNYLNPNGAFDWLKENAQKPENFETAKGYSTCHFWTNFEITNLDFLRSEAYEKYMDHLENSNGFYYERWGDAPVRSIALALFLDKSRIHWFRDIAYNHNPYTNCPKCPEGSMRCDGRCKPGLFTMWKDLNIENCQATWIDKIMSDEEKNLY
ncbi:putative mannosyltransferase NDAI_0C05480 [Naumovozyma dairenensis CBS 421]|uniref:Glycosyltransferase family 15 protein n=1 Tax=Naumovozyma dairenensis (strain ATCC 10597 / BCRC 20456 / CBS 421 / NBRC 0211 / NRRL Y-12639) TaxID=1071378 RepID=G0W8U6_NAUDC|nr:hypothetical protein NDAI_0C05480 [Naumovozyma dairenensis CBS 421]CCD24207.1 hypothetical protein NDAI_0C05480 [Naumovozyma dairenensis CBS 421]